MLTFAQLLKDLKLKSADDLNVDMLDVQSEARTFTRFDLFNAKVSPCVYVEGAPLALSGLTPFCLLSVQSHGLRPPAHGFHEDGQ